MLSVVFPHGPGGFPYIFFSTVDGSTLVTLAKGLYQLISSSTVRRKDIRNRARAIIYRAERQLHQERVRRISTILLDSGSRIAGK